MREEDLLSSLTLQKAGSTSISIWGKDQECPFLQPENWPPGAPIHPATPLQSLLTLSTR